MQVPKSCHLIVSLKQKIQTQLGLSEISMSLTLTLDRILLSKTNPTDPSLESSSKVNRQMARIIQKGSGKDVLEVVKWKEFVIIYLQSVVFNLFIVIKNILWCVKSYLSSRFSTTGQNIANKFPALSRRLGTDETGRNQQQPFSACPQQLMDAQLGHHKYMKLKVSARVAFRYVTVCHLSLASVSKCPSGARVYVDKMHWCHFIPDDEASLRGKRSRKRTSGAAASWLSWLLLRVAPPDFVSRKVSPSYRLRPKRVQRLGQAIAQAQLPAKYHLRGAERFPRRSENRNCDNRRTWFGRTHWLDFRHDISWVNMEIKMMQKSNFLPQSRLHGKVYCYCGSPPEFLLDHKENCADNKSLAKHNSGK